jgi:hypothetical protein
LPDLEIDHDTTRATANLPGLTIEVMHRRMPGAEAELISINMQAMPSFAAFGRYLDGINPFVFWAQFAQAAWLPWLGPWAGALMGFTRQSSAAPELGEEKKLTDGRGSA